MADTSLLGYMPPEVATVLMRAYNDVCVGCANKSVRRIFWTYTVYIKGKREKAYDTITLCAECYEKLHSSGWCDTHEVTIKQYRTWRLSHKEDWNYELAKENVHVAEI